MTIADLKPIQSRRKLQAAQAALRELALSLGPNAKMPTVRDICRAMKISAVTAENVLSGLEQQCVVIRRQGSGIYVSPRLHQRSVGLVFGQHAFEAGSSPFCALLIQCCQLRAQEHGERFSFYLDMPRNSSESDGPVHADLIEALSNRRLDGMLLVARHSSEQESWLRAQEIPVVSFTGGVVQPYQPSTVGFDLGEMALQGARALKDQGCKSVGMISAHASGSEAFARVMAAVGLPCRHELFIHPLKDAARGETRLQIGRRALRTLLSGAGEQRLDGVIVMDDMLTPGAILAAEDAGRTVGSDLLLTSHANKGSATLESQKSQLIQMVVDPEEMVEEMFAMLESMMSGKAVEPAAVTVASRMQIGAQVTRL